MIPLIDDNTIYAWAQFVQKVLVTGIGKRLGLGQDANLDFGPFPFILTKWWKPGVAKCGIDGIDADTLDQCLLGYYMAYTAPQSPPS